MGQIRTSRPSPAIIVAILALVAALAGTAVAGPGAVSSALTKSKVKTIATKQINALAPGLSVANAAHADKADLATTATNAVNANTVGGRSAAELESHAFNAAPGTKFVPAGAGTTTVATLDLPAGTYLILGRVRIDNNGAAAANNTITCSLIAGAASAPVAEGLALGAQSSVAESELGSGQLAHTFGSADQARIDCVTQAAWGSGNAGDPTISAVSVQP